MKKDLRKSSYSVLTRDIYACLLRCKCQIQLATEKKKNQNLEQIIFYFYFYKNPQNNFSFLDFFISSK